LFTPLIYAFILRPHPVCGESRIQRNVNREVSFHVRGGDEVKNTNTWIGRNPEVFLSQSQWKQRHQSKSFLTNEFKSMVFQSFLKKANSSHFPTRLKVAVFAELT